MSDTIAIFSLVSQQLSLCSVADRIDDGADARARARARAVNNQRESAARVDFHAWSFNDCDRRERFSASLRCSIGLHGRTDRQSLQICRCEMRQRLSVRVLLVA